jgi:hypothetical protein
MSDKNPGHGADQGGLEVFGEPSAPTEPGESALDNPAAWQHFDMLERARRPGYQVGCRAGRPDEETAGFLCRTLTEIRTRVKQLGLDPADD